MGDERVIAADATREDEAVEASIRPKRSLRISLMAWWDMFHVPFRCTPMTVSKSSSVMFQIMRSRSTPAALMTKSILPNVSAHWRTMRPALA